MSISPDGLFGHQQDPERFAQAISNIESKALDVKVNIEQLLLLLDLQEKVEWPDMLDKFSSLASAMTQLQSILKKSAIPSGFEDYGFFLRTHVLVPHCLSNEIDPNIQVELSGKGNCSTRNSPSSERRQTESDHHFRRQFQEKGMEDVLAPALQSEDRLHKASKMKTISSPDLRVQQATGNRIQCWNHDVAPEYLRTKLTPEIENDEAHIDNEKNARTFDQVNKQILAMNKHIEALLASLADNARSLAEAQQDIPTHSSQDTQKLVRAIVNGEGLRPSRGNVSSDSSQGSGAVGQHMGARPGSMMSPQQRR